MKCEYGKENCIHAGMEHDEECCFNGYYDHKYICQECGFSSEVVSTENRFPAKKCPKGCNRGDVAKSFV